MREPRSYIVRAYRQGYATLSGIVEDTHTGRKWPFRDIQQLSALLRGTADGHHPKSTVRNSDQPGRRRKP